MCVLLEGEIKEVRGKIPKLEKKLKDAFSLEENLWQI